MSSFVAIIERNIYGTSGTELMPPKEKTETIVFLSLPEESKEAFSKFVQNFGMFLREKAENTPSKENSVKDGINWSIKEIGERPTQFDRVSIKKQYELLEKGIHLTEDLLTAVKRELEELQKICTHPNKVTSNIAGDYYSKGYTYTFCPDCKKSDK